MCKKQKAFWREFAFDPDAFSVCMELTSTACVLSRALRRTQGRPLKPLTVMNAQVDAHVSASENANEVCNWDKLSQKAKERV